MRKISESSEISEISESLGEKLNRERTPRESKVVSGVFHLLKTTASLTFDAP